MFIDDESGKTKMSYEVFSHLAGILSTECYDAAHCMEVRGCICIHTYISISAIYLLNKHRQINKLFLKKCNINSVGNILELVASKDRKSEYM